MFLIFVRIYRIPRFFQSVHLGFQVASCGSSRGASNQHQLLCAFSSRGKTARASSSSSSSKVVRLLTVHVSPCVHFDSLIVVEWFRNIGRSMDGQSWINLNSRSYFALSTNKVLLNLLRITLLRGIMGMGIFGVVRNHGSSCTFGQSGGAFDL